MCVEGVRDYCPWQLKGATEHLFVVVEVSRIRDQGSVNRRFWLKGAGMLHILLASPAPPASLGTSSPVLLLGRERKKQLLSRHLGFA